VYILGLAEVRDHAQCAITRVPVAYSNLFRSELCAFTLQTLGTRR